MSVAIMVGVDEPPAVPHTIYTDIVLMPNPMKLGVTVKVFNYDSVTLYMKVDGSAAGWTFTEENLGSVASGGNLQKNLDQFGSRALPSAETTEDITVRLRAYTDAGYTNLKWTYERTVEMVFIKSDDGSWTEDFLNNFDDGTVQGWAVAAELGQAATFPIIAADTGFVLSPPYSCRMRHQRTTTAGLYRARLYKSFTTPDRARVFAIIDARFDSDMFEALPHTKRFNKYIEIRQDSTVLKFIGKNDSTTTPNFPEEKWMRSIVPLTPNSIIEVQIAHQAYDIEPAGGGRAQVNLDDFKIISKN